MRAAFALASYDPNSPRWQQVRRAVVDQLIAENPAFLGLWIEGFRGVREALLEPLANAFRDRQRRESERTVATSVLSDYAADRPRLLAELLTSVTPAISAARVGSSSSYVGIETRLRATVSYLSFICVEVPWAFT